MSGPYEPGPSGYPPERPPRPAPPYRQPPPPPPRNSFLGVALALSLWLNLFLLILAGGGVVVLVVLIVAGMAGDGSTLPLQEKVYAGKSSARDKIAVIRIDGLLMEGLVNYATRQIDTVAEDKNVKAVVVRIDSPGGTITASDDLYKRLVDLRDGNPEKKTDPKKHLVVSMGGMAASGGYYIAMPAQTLVAERSTITGSIGVYAALPNISKLADKYGVEMNIIKRGDLKASGSMFKEMQPNERQEWDDMVANAYAQFQQVVEEGRPALKGKLQEHLFDTEKKGLKEENGKQVEVTFKYARYRADGGIFTADEALKYGLIDKIGYLDDAIKEAKQAAALGQDYKVITYDKPFSLQEALTGAQSAQPAGKGLDPARLAEGAAPRLWYLAPGSELEGILSAAGR
jgi:protease-4